MAMQTVRGTFLARALIEDEVVPGNLSEHPIAQTLSDWKQRATGRGGTYTLTLSESDLMLAMDLLDQYRERLRLRTLAALDGVRLAGIAALAVAAFEMVKGATC